MYINQHILAIPKCIFISKHVVYHKYVQFLPGSGKLFQKKRFLYATRHAGDFIHSISCTEKSSENSVSGSATICYIES